MQDNPVFLKQKVHLKIMRKYIYIIYFLLSFSIFLCKAQVKQSAYREFIIESREGDNYRIFKAGAKQVLCVLESNNRLKGNKQRAELTLMDKDLQIIWQQNYFISRKENIIGYLYHKGYIYLLTSTANYIYRFLRINSISTAVEVITYESDKNFYITHFTILNHTIFLGGVVNNYPIVYQFDYLNKQTTILSSIHQFRAELMDIFANEANNEIIVILSKNYGTKDRGVFINRYDREGNLKSNLNIDHKFEYKLLNFQTTLLKDRKIFILGTYALRNNNKTQGIYAIRLGDEDVEYIRFYDFTYLKNFFRYLPEKRMKKLKVQIRKKREKDKNYYLKYNIFPHNLSFCENRIVFSGEIYRPIIEDNSRFTRPNRSIDPNLQALYGNFDPTSIYQNTNFSQWGSFTPSALNRHLSKSYTRPSGYAYSHSFVCAFDGTGRMLWDNSYNFNENTIQNLPIEMSQVAVKNDTVVFAHAEDKYIYSKWSVASQYTDTAMVDTIAMLPGEKLYELNNGGLIKWYDMHFIHSGLKKIKNKFDAGKNREVFFIAKFSYVSPTRKEQ